jgi:ketosteroid isomerase-like protein
VCLRRRRTADSHSRWPSSWRSPRECRLLRRKRQAQRSRPEAFIQSFSGFLRAVDKVLPKQLIVEGPNAAAVVSHDYVNPSGGHLHQDDAEVWKVENGQIVSLTVYFDITEFRGFMGR